MSTHTPGPWELSGDAVPAGHVQITVYAPNGTRVATVFEREANARLIAAAPDMYEALQMAAPCLDSYLNGQGTVTADELDAALTAITLALARANP